MLALLKLNEVANYKIQLDIDLNDHSDLDVKLTKIKFNELCEELYSKTTKLIDEALNTKGLQASDIDYVVILQFSP